MGKGRQDGRAVRELSIEDRQKDRQKESFNIKDTNLLAKRKLKKTLVPTFNTISKYCFHSKRSCTL